MIWYGEFMAKVNPLNKQQEISTYLLSWYHQNARKLPWRETKDPYAIWVSEVMLQQTRVETVIPYYKSFLQQFPTVDALAAASENEILKAWEGLGYYRRAKLLLKGAQEVVKNFNSRLPDDPKALASLPGVGTYMSGSLASIAFNLPVPAVDGNVIRVVTRILAWEEEASTPSAKRQITDWVRQQFPLHQAGDFTQALMELGALVCLPRAPRCHDCPLLQYCKGTLDNPERFPVKKIAREIPAERRIVLRIRWNQMRLLLQRPKEGLMAGFWEYPTLVAGTVDDALELAEKWAQKQLGVSLHFIFFRAMIHEYTHLRWNLEIFDGEWKEKKQPKLIDGGFWFSAEKERQLPRVAYIRKLNSLEMKS
ncbi:MAG TPA: A/G-specific adenine glycosylase [Firmicutes bacterium]|jgi:A/G-specific adenine glycosylase|nr:A/G-specific adenine glycosylase [Bacillota bacterium]